MFPRWKYSLFQSWFRRTFAFQKPLAFLSEIINCFTNIFDSKQLIKNILRKSIFLLFDAKMETQEEMSRYFWSASTNCLPVHGDCKFDHCQIHPRSQGLTADTALPKALAKTKTRSDLIGRMNTMECGNWTWSFTNKYGWL
jgi:hypothetical protein